MTHRSATTGRIDCFESLRGLMALWVVIGHVLLTFNTPALEQTWLWRFFADNWRAVDIFIILSGFVIFHLLAKKQEDYRDYLYRRFMRLFPAYLICLLISAAMLPLSIRAVEAFAAVTPRNADRLGYLLDSWNNLWVHLGVHLSMLQGAVPARLLPFTDYAILGQAWSISLEWQFYILAPMAFWLATLPRRWAGLAGLALGMLVLFYLKKHFGGGFIGSHLACFAIGAASSMLWIGLPDLQRRFAPHARLAIPVLLALCLLLPSSLRHFAIWGSVFLAAAAARFEGGERGLPGWILRTLSVPALRWLGKISYSVYLVHMIPLFGTLWLLRHSGLDQTTLMAATMLATVVVTLCASALMYHWVEMPAMDFARRRANCKALQRPASPPKLAS